MVLNCFIVFAKQMFGRILNTAQINYSDSSFDILNLKPMSRRRSMENNSAWFLIRLLEFLGTFLELKIKFYYKALSKL